MPARRKVPVLFLSPAIQSFLGYRVIIYGSELIAVAISVAYLYSSAVVFGLEGKYFFWELLFENSSEDVLRLAPSHESGKNYYWINNNIIDGKRNRMV